MLPEGVKAKKLDWQSLAEAGGAPQLYGYYRQLSGVSSHITGVSIVMGATTEGAERLQQELHDMTRRVHPMLMAGATLHGSLCHAQMIENDDLVRVALPLIERMNVLSESFPGVNSGDSCPVPAGEQAD